MPASLLVERYLLSVDMVTAGTRKDVDEAVVVVMNTLDAGQVRGWLMRYVGDIRLRSIASYFFRELEQHRPAALRYFRKPEF